MCLSVTLPVARHLIYILPYLVLMIFFKEKSIRIGDEGKPFILIIASGLLFFLWSNKEGFKDIYFIITGISISFLIDIPRVNTSIIAIVLTICMFVNFVFCGNIKNGFEFDLLRSVSTFEGSFSYMFGIIGLLSIIERKFILYSFCLFLTVLSLKRIAIAALIIGSFFVFLGEKRARVVLNPVIMVAVNLAILLTIVLYGTGTFDFLINNLAGISSNQFTQGRRLLLSLPSAEIYMNFDSFLLFGKGPGSAYVLANKSFNLIGTDQRLHSDILKIVYEYGAVIFCFFIWLMYSAKSYLTRIAFLYMNILFISDNTLIYSFYLVLFSCCVRRISLVHPADTCLIQHPTSINIFDEGHRFSAFRNRDPKNFKSA